jgi:hypothetical protein
MLSLDVEHCDDATRYRGAPRSAIHGEPSGPLDGSAGTSPVSSAEWRARAAEVMTTCETALWSEEGVKALAWLRRRGLRDDTLRSWRIGFCDRDGVLHGLPMHRGIVIPGVAVNGQLSYLKVRRAGTESGYVVVSGSRPALVGRLTGKRVLLLAQTDLDALFAHQEVGDMLDVATFGVPRARPRPWLLWLDPYPVILASLEPGFAVEGGRGPDGERPRTGRRAMAIPRARWLRLPLDAEREPGAPDDAEEAGQRLRALLRLAIYVADRPGEPAPHKPVEVATGTSNGETSEMHPAFAERRESAPKPSRSCSSCSSDAWWERATGGWVCGVCHPDPTAPPSGETQ